MKLLITTQAIDLDDPVLGFFHGWVAEFAKRCTSVHVICLKEGRHSLPKQVAVHSLGKSPQQWRSFIQRVCYAVRFYRYAWQLRHEYDAVFVHMNAEYVLLGGLLWRALSKEVILWRNHKKGGWMTWLAAHLTSTVCYTSPSAYVARFGNAARMPIGIDTKTFSPAGEAQPRRVLFLGRLDEVKKPDVFLEAMAALLREGADVHADMYGDPTRGREKYADALKKRFSGLSNVTFRPGVRNVETVALYRSHGIYVNLTPSGSFDKTIGEAMACGCIVVAANEALRGAVPDALLVDPSSPAAVARGMHAALALSEAERATLVAQGRQWIEREHSLVLLTERLSAILCA